MDTHIVTARATSEERKIYVERNKEGGREKAGALAQHSGYSGDMKRYFHRRHNVPPMEFDMDKKLWEASAHRLASRQISTEKQTAHTLYQIYGGVSP